jgi:hypothetical protein
MPKDAPATEKSTIDALYACYRAWGTATGHAGVARNKLAQRLKGLGYESRMKVARLYRLRLNERWEKIMSEHTQNGEKGLTYGRRNAYHAN